MTYVYYTDSKGEWRWRLRAANGRIIADSTVAHKNVSDCLDEIRLVKASKEASVQKE